VDELCHYVFDNASWYLAGNKGHFVILTRQVFSSVVTESCESHSEARMRYGSQLHEEVDGHTPLLDVLSRVLYVITPCIAHIVHEYEKDQVQGAQSLAALIQAAACWAPLQGMTRSMKELCATQDEITAKH